MQRPFPFLSYECYLTTILVVVGVLGLLKPKVLYMCFDNFLLAVESRDLSQADKSIIMVSSFPS